MKTLCANIIFSRDNIFRCSAPCPLIAPIIQLCELSNELEKKHSDVPDLCSLKAAVHVPDIIHSTVMRLASEPSDARLLSEGLAGLRARWEPATVKVGELSLVYEKHPYMHLSRTEGEVNRYALPFC